MEPLKFEYKEWKMTDVNGNIIKTGRTRLLNGREWQDADVAYYNGMDALIKKYECDTTLEDAIKAMTVPVRRKAVAL